MKRDFDFVMFDDYASDMGEIAHQASATVSILRKERDDARKLVAWIIASVGCIKLPDRVLQSEPPPIIREYDYASMSIVLRPAREGGGG